MLCEQGAFTLNLKRFSDVRTASAPRYSKTKSLISRFDVMVPRTPIYFQQQREEAYKNFDLMI